MDNMQRSLAKIVVIGVMLSYSPTVFAQVKQADTDSTAKELTATYGNDIDNLKNTLEEQGRIVSKIVADQQRDRTQMRNVMESIMDRLEKIDKNMQGLEDKIERFNFKD